MVKASVSHREPMIRTQAYFWVVGWLLEGGRWEVGGRWIGKGRTDLFEDDGLEDVNSCEDTEYDGDGHGGCVLRVVVVVGVAGGDGDVAVGAGRGGYAGAFFVTDS